MSFQSYLKVEMALRAEIIFLTASLTSLAAENTSLKSQLDEATKVNGASCVRWTTARLVHKPHPNLNL